MDTEYLGVRIDRDLSEALRMESARRELSVSQLVRVALIRELSRMPAECVEVET